jgi:hypothetical protein
MRKSGFHLRPRSTAPCVELRLRLPDGSPWRLTVSPGIERFIGHYPLVDGLDPGDALLRFRAIDPA